MHEMWKRQQVPEHARTMYRAEILVKEFAKMVKRHMGGHDTQRRVDMQREVLIWCRKCSHYARQRVGPQLMNCCKPEQVGTQEHGKMLKRIQALEDGRVPAKEERIQEIHGTERSVERRQREDVAGHEVCCQRKKETL